MIRLNRHTFVRDMGDCIYMENQVAHTKAYFVGEEYPLAKSLACGDSVACDSKSKSFVETCNDLWLSDADGDGTTADRDFHYATKREAEAVSERSPYSSYRPRKPWLQNLQIELTDACNERCIHCYLPDYQKDKAKTMSSGKVKDLLRQYRDMNGLKVVFSGGEILLHKDLFDILEECRRLNLMILLQSNLLALTAEALQRIKSLDVFNVQVSLYSTDPQIHDGITGRKGSWLRTKRNLELLVENDIPALISCPVMQQNFPTVEALRQYADELGVDIYFDFIMMAQCDGSSDNLNGRLTVDQTRQMIRHNLCSDKMAVSVIKQAKTEEELRTKMFARRWAMCDILSAGVCVDAQGNVYPCPGWNGMQLGNLETDSLEHLWQDSEKAKELRSIKKEDFRKCRKCDLHNYCDMCAVYNYNENGDALHVCNRFCETAQMTRQCVMEIYKETHNKH